MRKKYLFLSLIIICAIGVISTTTVNSHIVYPPAGFCGDPTTATTNLQGLSTGPYQTCVTSSCHGGQPQTVTAQNLNIVIGTDTTSQTPLNSSFAYVPNQTYYITFSVLATGYVWGFELTALNPDTTMAGAFATHGDNERIDPAIATGAPSYIGHLHANHNISSWTFTWTAPATDSNVTFYYAFNAGDSLDFINDVPDQNIFADTVIIQASSAGIRNIANNISGLQIYPNPVDGAFSLSFDVLTPGAASAQIYSVDGKFCRQLFNENLAGGTFNRNYSIASLAAGIYLVKLNVNGASVTKKIVKE